MYNPILIVGNDNEKKKLILKSFYRTYLTDSKSYKIECFDFHPLKSQYLTDLIPNNKKKYVLKIFNKPIFNLFKIYMIIIRIMVFIY